MKKKTFCMAFLLGIALLMIPAISHATDGDIIVMLDPGHGKYGTGANNSGADEATVNWKIAYYVKEILDQTPGITGILTRTETTNPSLANRAILAKDNGADLLVSFHINSGEGIFNRMMGAETYITGDTKQVRFNRNSSILAKDILANLRSIGIPSNKLEPILKFSTDGELYSDGMLSDYYGIIRNPMYYGIPAVLIEHCYINSPQDRNFINTDEKIRKIAQQDAQAIIKNKELFRIDKTGNCIATGIQTINMATNDKGHPYLYGEVIVNNWINDMRADPSVTPRIWLKSTDGTKKYECWVVRVQGNLYYFDSLLDNIDSSKSYLLEIESQEKNAIPIYHTQKMDMPEKILGWIGKEEVCISNNELTIRGKDYIGDIANDITTLSLEKNQQGRAYLKGEMFVTEWINGVTWSIPKRTPKLCLKATDDSISYSFWVNPIGLNQYYFDGYIDTIDLSKEYVFEIESGSIENISPYRKVQGIYSKQQELGQLKREKLVIDNSVMKIVPTNYYGDIATQIYELELEQNEQGKTYIKGGIAITEWIGTQWNKPEGIPTMVLKATDNSLSYSFWVNPIESNQYYFDGYIEGIDTSKEYFFEVELQNSYNISKYKKQNAYYGKDVELGTYQKQKVKFTEENKLIFGEDKYIGDIATQIQTFSLEQNEQGKHYIKGEIAVTEWIDGITWSIPKKMPQVKMIATDGSLEYECWVNPIGSNQYYFDTYIEGIDISKTYVIEVTSGSSNNISKYKKQTAYYGKDVILGKYQDSIMQFTKNQIRFDELSYRGDIANEIQQIMIESNKIKGRIIVTEWIDGITWSIPREIPKIFLETKEQGINIEGIVKQINHTNTYEFSFDISQIDKEKSYFIKVVSGSNKNTSSYRIQQGIYAKNEVIGTFEEWNIKIQDNKILFVIQQQIFSQNFEKNLERLQQERVNVPKENLIEKKPEEQKNLEQNEGFDEEKTDLKEEVN